MSIAGYYDSVIREWRSQQKKTPSLKKEMRKIIDKFYAIRDYYKEIPEHRIKDLTIAFKEIERQLDQ